uniref:Large ribosomal subunit protein eL22 n=1 Tax=Echinostoma caproni TaxID=27848 RepID=A0A183A1U4_9TREM
LVPHQTFRKIQKVPGKKKQQLKFTIGCAPRVIDEDIVSFHSFEGYLKERIKVNGKLNNFGKDVHVERDDNTIIVTSNVPFSKRYEWYLQSIFF